MSQRFALGAFLLPIFFPGLSCAEDAGGRSATSGSIIFKGAQGTATILPDNVPDWVNDPTLGGKVIAAFGVSDPVLAGPQAQRARAMVNARQELSASVSSQLLAVTKAWLQECGAVSASNANLNVSIEKMAREISSNLFSVQKSRWIEEKTGKMYVHIVVSDLKGSAQATKKAVRANPEIKACLSTSTSEQAYSKFEAMIDKIFQEEKSETK